MAAVWTTEAQKYCENAAAWWRCISWQERVVVCTLLDVCVQISGVFVACFIRITAVTNYDGGPPPDYDAHFGANRNFGIFLASILFITERACVACLCGVRVYDC